MMFRQPKSGSRRRGIADSLKTLVVALLLSLAFRTVVAEPFTVPSGSMIPTLLVGDTLLASKYAYGFGKFSSPLGLMPDFDGRVLGHAPERGDVVVFRLPRDPGTSYVKRVIGLPGDRIQMKGGRLHISDVQIPRREIGTVNADLGGRTIPLHAYIETLPNGREHRILEISDSQDLDDTDEFLVPANRYFVMGDNRDDSLDSRVAVERNGVGFVPEENLIGRVDRLLYSRDPSIGWLDFSKWPQLFRLSRLFEAIG